MLWEAVTCLQGPTIAIYIYVVRNFYRVVAFSLGHALPHAWVQNCKSQGRGHKFFSIVVFFYSQSKTIQFRTILSTRAIICNRFCQML